MVDNPSDNPNLAVLAERVHHLSTDLEGLLPKIDSLLMGAVDKERRITTLETAYGRVLTWVITVGSIAAATFLLRLMEVFASRAVP